MDQFEKMKEAIDKGLTIQVSSTDANGDPSVFYFDNHSVAYFLSEGKPLSVDTGYEDILEFLEEFQDDEWEVVSFDPMSFDPVSSSASLEA